MPGFIDSVKNFGSDLLCGLAETEADFRKLLGAGIESISGVTPPALPQLEYYRRAVCRLGAQPIPFGLSVPGGKCQGTLYQVTAEGVITYRTSINATPKTVNVKWRSPNAQSSNRAEGPIGGFSNLGVEYGGGDGFGLELTGIDGSADGSYPMIAFENSGGGYVSGATPYQSISSAQITNIDVISGPNNCGNTPAGGGPSIVPFCYQDTMGQTVCVDVEPTVRKPYVGPGGRIIFPIDLPFGGVNIRIDVDVSGGETVVYPAPPDNPPIDPNDLPFLPSQPLPPIPDGEPPAEDDGDEYIGAVVTVTTTSPDTIATIIDNGVAPDIYAPRLGTITFGYVIAQQKFWGRDIAIKGKRQFIAVEGMLFANSFKLDFYPGFTGSAVGIIKPLTVIES